MEGDDVRKRGMFEDRSGLPTALLSMIDWTFALAAEDILLDAKNRRRNEMVGNGEEGG